MKPVNVAVIDIGSNSIKVLVAHRGAAGLPVAVLSRTIEARISAGISRAVPSLSAEGMSRGLAAIRELLAQAAPHAPARIELVATSAVRDASNGGEFREQVRRETGHAIRILSGEEEANLIGLGLTCDPALQGLGDFYLFDLGGGSLECLAFQARRIRQAVSLQLGCVRLTERFVTARDAAVGPAVLQTIAAHTREVLHAAAFDFSLPAGAAAVGTGGTMTTARAIFAAEAGEELEAGPPLLALDRLRDLRDRLAALPLEERCAVPGLSAARADVFPAALATLVAVAERGGFPGFHHSLYNLRFGLAAELLPA